VLDGTTASEATRWAHENGITRDIVTHSHTNLLCCGVDANKLSPACPPVSELWLSFGPIGHLIGVAAHRCGISASDTTAAWARTTDVLRNALGAPTVTKGDAPF